MHGCYTSHTGISLDAGVSACTEPSHLDEFESWIEEFRLASCDRLNRCADRAWRWPSVEVCVEHDPFVAFETRLMYEQQLDRVERGELAFASVAAQRCSEALRSPCELPLDPGPIIYSPNGLEACHLVLVPRCPRSHVEVCSTLGECGESRYCAVPTDPTARDDACLVGRCHDSKPVGTTCDFEYECLRPSRGAVTCGGMLHDRVCQELEIAEEVSRAGEFCGLVEESRLVECAEGLYCNEATCVTEATNGERCHAGECRAGLHCDTSIGVCVAVATRSPVAEGTTCSADDLCDFQADTSCIDGVCMGAGHALGAPCKRTAVGFGIERETCSYPWVCDPVTDTCIEPEAAVVDGEPCWRDSDCLNVCCRRSSSGASLCYPPSECCN